MWTVVGVFGTVVVVEVGGGTKQLKMVDR